MSNENPNLPTSTTKEVTRNRDTASDKIRAFYLDTRGHVQLTDKQEEIRQRLVAAHAMVLSGKTDKEIALKMAKRFQVTETQAYRDIKDCINLFGNVMKAEKEGYRYIASQQALNTFALAKKAGDLKMMVAANANFTKIWALDKEEPDLPDFSKLEPSTYTIEIPEVLEKALMALISQGRIDLSKMYNKISEDAEFTDITEGSDTGGD